MTRLRWQLDKRHEFAATLIVTSSADVESTSFDQLAASLQWTQSTPDAIYANLTTETGTTTGQYQSLLAANATYLGALGVVTADASRLFSFEIQQAGAFLPGGLTQSTDLSLPAPGLSLTFNRVHHDSISGRYQLGTLGFGWTHNWEIGATVAPDGREIEINFAGSRVHYTLQADGTYRSAEDPGAALNLLAGSQIRLRQADGRVIRFHGGGRLDFWRIPTATGSRRATTAGG